MDVLPVNARQRGRVERGKGKTVRTHKIRRRFFVFFLVAAKALTSTIRPFCFSSSAAAREITQPADLRNLNPFLPDKDGQNNVQRVEKAVSGNDDRDGDLGDRIVGAKRRDGWSPRNAPVPKERPRRQGSNRRWVRGIAVRLQVLQLRVIELRCPGLRVVGVDAEALALKVGRRRRKKKM